MMIFFWAALGLCLGSFANVCIHRLPKEISLLRPASRCPACGKGIAFYDNVPLLSFLWLLGRCRSCREPISPRYPVVEALLGLLGAALWLRWQSSTWTLLALWACVFLAAIAFIDWDTFLIPDGLSLGLLGLGLASAPFNPLFEGAWGGRLVSSFWGAAFGFILCLAVALAGEKIFKKEAMGGGDVKLLAAVGAWSGTLGAFDCLMTASLAGALYGAALLLRGKIARQEPIPFGPFLSAGAVFNFFYLLPFGFPFS